MISGRLKAVNQWDINSGAEKNKCIVNTGNSNFSDQNDGLFLKGETNLMAQKSSAIDAVSENGRLHIKNREELEGCGSHSLHQNNLKIYGKIK
jgi:hypothetical protein